MHSSKCSTLSCRAFQVCERKTKTEHLFFNALLIKGAHVSYCSPNTDFRIMCVSVAPTLIAGIPSQWHSLGQYFTSERGGKEIAQLGAAEKARLLSAAKLDKCR